MAIAIFSSIVIVIVNAAGLYFSNEGTGKLEVLLNTNLHTTWKLENASFLIYDDKQTNFNSCRVVFRSDSSYIDNTLSQLPAPLLLLPAPPSTSTTAVLSPCMWFFFSNFSSLKMCIFNHGKLDNCKPLNSYCKTTCMQCQPFWPVKMWIYGRRMKYLMLSSYKCIFLQI